MVKANRTLVNSKLINVEKLVCYQNASDFLFICYFRKVDRPRFELLTSQQEIIEKDVGELPSSKPTWRGHAWKKTK